MVRDRRPRGSVVRGEAREYRALADEHFEADAYAEFCAGPLAHLDELAYEWFTSDEFDQLLVDTVHSTFPEHEHEQFVAHYRGLLRSWAEDQAASAV